MFKSFAVAASAAVAVLTSLTVAAQGYPSGAMDPESPEAQEFYSERCNAYADEQGLSDEARDAYVARCVADGPKVWPMGYEKPAE